MNRLKSIVKLGGCSFLARIMRSLALRVLGNSGDRPLPIILDILSYILLFEVVTRHLARNGRLVANRQFCCCVSLLDLFRSHDTRTAIVSIFVLLLFHSIIDINICKVFHLELSMNDLVWHLHVAVDTLVTLAVAANDLPVIKSSLVCFKADDW